MADAEWKHMLTSLADSLDGVFFDIDAPEDSIKKVEEMIKTAKLTDAPEPGRKRTEVFGDPTPEQTQIMTDLQSLDHPPEGIIFWQPSVQIAGYKMSETSVGA